SELSQVRTRRLPRQTFGSRVLRPLWIHRIRQEMIRPRRRRGGCFKSVTYSPASPRRLVWIDFQAPDLVTWVQIPTRALLTASGLLSSHQVLGVPQKFHSPLASRDARPFPEGRLSDSRRSRPGR